MEFSTDDIFKMLLSDVKGDRLIAKTIIENKNNEDFYILKDEFEKRKTSKVFTVLVYDIFFFGDIQRKNSN